MRISDWSSDVCSSDLISKADSLYEVGRAYDVFTLTGQMCIHDDGEIFSCDLTPHGKARKIFTTREPLAAISAITPFNHPLNMVAHKVAPSIATNNCMVVKTRSEEHTSELQSLMRISYAVFCLKKKT